MTWMYILFGIILLGCGLWGWIARLKWMEEQGRESKKTNKFITPFSHFKKKSTPRMKDKKDCGSADVANFLSIRA